MATIANLQILLSARADSLNATLKKSVASLKAYTNTVDAMKDARVNFKASVDQVRAGVTQAKRLVQNLSRTPAALLIGAKVDKAKATIDRFRRSDFGVKLAIKGEDIAERFAFTGIRAQQMADIRSIERAAAAVGVDIDLSGIARQGEAGLRVAMLGIQKQIDDIVSKPPAAKKWVAELDASAAEMKKKGEELAKINEEKKGMTLVSEKVMPPAPTRMAIRLLEASTRSMVEEVLSAARVIGPVMFLRAMLPLSRFISGLQKE